MLGMNHLETTMQWMPGHEGIEGNEKADKEAKKAAAGETSEDHLVPLGLRGVLPISKSAELQRHKKALKKESKSIFAKSPRSKYARESDPSMPAARFAKMCKHLPQKHASLFIQLQETHKDLWQSRIGEKRINTYITTSTPSRHTISTRANAHSSRTLALHRHGQVPGSAHRAHVEIESYRIDRTR
jgi:hypothetical protein